MRNPTLMVQHPEASRERLLAYARQVPGAYVGMKIAALLLTLEGQRPGWITETLGLTRQSLNAWMHKVNQEGLKALQSKPRPGRPGRLTHKERQQLEQDLEKAPLDFGLHRSGWDGPTLVVHLKRTFGITLRVRQAQYLMHHLGYRLKRAGYSYVQARGKDARKFHAALKKTPKSGAW